MLELEALQGVLLEKRGAVEETPFGPDALVFKVSGKMFALVAWEESPLKITLKCDPHDALALREQYEAVKPGYYMNKRHWNTVALDGTIADHEIRDMIDDSYDLVVAGLPKAAREKLARDD